MGAYGPHGANPLAPGVSHIPIWPICGSHVWGASGPEFKSRRSDQSFRDTRKTVVPPSVPTSEKSEHARAP
jgi:hypothetical protein